MGMGMERSGGGRDEERDNGRGDGSTLFTKGSEYGIWVHIPHREF